MLAEWVIVQQQDSLTHSRSIGSTSPSLSIVCSRSMPSQTKQHRAIATIVIIIMLNQTLSHRIIDLLVILLGRRKDIAPLLALRSATLLGRLRRPAEGKVSSHTSKCGGCEAGVKSGIAAAAAATGGWSGRLVCVASATLALEGLAWDCDSACGGSEG